MSVMRVPVLSQPLVFVDIETNGLDHVRGRVVEVAAIRVEDGKIVKTFNSLIDPETELPYFITKLTGITSHDLRGAPTFGQIADELREVMAGAIFVAHNVRFDYSFLKQEFKRLDQAFLPKQLCTVKLSRALYPEQRSHKLQSLIERHGFTYAQRHRAYDDAAILWQFTQYICKNFTPEQITAAIGKQLASPAVPNGVHPNLVRNLPESPGVYIFEDGHGQPLYIGKSVNIKKRVMSHFGRDHAEAREFKIAQSVKNIRAEKTSGELTALLLESKLIKDMQPVYNRQLRRLNKLLLAKQMLNADGYAQVGLHEVDGIDPETASDILAVYPRRGRAKEALNDMVRTFDLCPKLMGLEKATGACFLRQLHKCRGACEGVESAEAYNQRLLTAFEHQRIHAWPFKGPIMVEENSQSTNQEALIIDNWCVVGRVTQEPYCEPVVTQSHQSFDLDTYKILHSYLTNKVRQLTIRTLDQNALLQFGI